MRYHLLRYLTLLLAVLTLSLACAGAQPRLAAIADQLPSEPLSCESVTDHADAVESILRTHAEPLAELETKFEGLTKKRVTEALTRVAKIKAQTLAAVEAGCAIKRVRDTLEAIKERTSEDVKALAAAVEALDLLRERQPLAFPES